MKRAILLVSFGTSYEDTRKKTLDVMLDEMRAHFPECPVYQAWICERILRKLETRDGLHIDTVEQAMQRMHADGVTDLLVQPAHMVDGIENERMKADVVKYEENFRKVFFGDPLLTSDEDCARVFSGSMKYFTLSEGEALVYVGHGTDHSANRVYTDLQELIAAYRLHNVFMVTMKGSPSILDILNRLDQTGIRRIILAPFMVVAGEHARNDMSGDQEDSIKSICLQQGFEAECVIRGLGEYPEVRAVLIDHAEKAMKNLAG